ncbi:hypothetical protein GCM10007881_28040 [Mesorhizobium huakuii]|uniref:hypothetical protein n=1 Tax=Mesorhizobium huakuii TaxID=28104 RepID=UPI00235C86EF|nr:hypothetical protein [Mesorhizobium huakuii]GLQ79286.1 hypothetical protein GCM10007881_28040 [Mesorhizobium huakuii]
MKRPAIAYARPTASTRTGNGSALLEGIDGRTAGARRYRELLFRLNGELQLELSKAKRRMTTQQELLLRRAAFLALWCETTEAKLVNGEDIDIDAFNVATNTLRRILTDTGLPLN